MSIGEKRLAVKQEVEMLSHGERISKTTLIPIATLAGCLGGALTVFGLCLGGPWMAALYYGGAYDPEPFLIGVFLLLPFPLGMILLLFSGLLWAVSRWLRR
jgi:hypothetical protein